MSSSVNRRLNLHKVTAGCDGCTRIESNPVGAGHRKSGGIDAVKRTAARHDKSTNSGWRFAVAVTRWSRSTQLLYLHRARLVLGWVTAFGQVNCLIT